MKKVLTLFALVAFSSSVFAATGISKLSNSLNQAANTLTQKEKAVKKY